MLDKYHINYGIDHLRDTQKILKCLKEIKDNMLMYKKNTKDIEVIDCVNTNFVGCIYS